MPLTNRFQYEVDGSIETHNTALPSTTSCPYMPGQTVNTLVVPVEQALRHRSVSLNSMRLTDFMTMDPNTKFSTLRPAPAPVDVPFRLKTSPVLNHKASTRSLSPAPAWKRFFTRKTGRDCERGRSPVRESKPSYFGSDDFDGRCTTPSDGTRTRDISPESLRRFLSDDIPSRPGSNLSVRPTVVIPERIPEDNDVEIENENENDDDDNFATSAVSETQTYPTRLSPPPFRRTASCESGLGVNASSTTLMPRKSATLPLPLPLSKTQDAPTSAILPSRPRLDTFSSFQFGFSTPSYFTSPVSPQYPEDENQAYFDLTDDEDDVVSSNNSDIFSGQPTVNMSVKQESYECYSLPEPEEKPKKIMESQTSFSKMTSVSGSNLLGSPINTGLDDFVSELGWMVDVIGTKHN